MSILEYILFLPLVAGTALFLVPEREKAVKGLIALIISIVVMTSAIGLFSSKEIIAATGLRYLSGISTTITNLLTKYEVFRIDELSKLVVLCCCIFTMLVTLYSIIYMGREKKHPNYYSYVLLTAGASNGAVLANNLLLFLFFWGVLGITLFKLITLKNRKTLHAASKSLILIGGSDALMMMGIVIIWKTQGTLNMSELTVNTDGFIEIIALSTLLIGSFTKAGAFPFHTWIPEYTRLAPASSSAYLPASLDKLLGIYFLARILHGIFIINNWITLIILSLGSLTIIIGVMMALVQTNYKKLLGYHAVSQVGYMIVGLGLGSIIGIIGGLFHMINNALYKSGLFLSAGCIEQQSGRNKITELGGLSKTMPVTFVMSLIFALSISGVPPFNGFASKWIIYQGIIEFGSQAGIANSLWILWLGMAVIGSALTLASFIKFISGLFLGRQKGELSHVKEANPIMLIPITFLALVCVVTGVLATQYVVPYLFNGIVGESAFIGSWSSGLISLLVVASIALGIIIYLIGNFKGLRKDDSFVGGEKNQESLGHSVSEFYHTIHQFSFFSYAYELAKKKRFDIYELSKNFGFWLNSRLKKTHNGILTSYALWLVIGLVLMLILLTYSSVWN